jgi:hypothetical protein
LCTGSKCFGDAPRTGTICPVITDLTRNSSNINIILIRLTPRNSM